MITEDNLVVGIDTVIYFTVTDPKAATYEIANPLQAIEQLTVTTLRNVIGGLTLEETLTRRDNINSQLRVVLDEATGKWGIRVNRVELKSVEPPRTVQEAMEKQMRAERDRRAAILTAEGFKQSQILTAEGEKQAAVLQGRGRADGGDPARRGRVEGDRDRLPAPSTRARPTRRCSPTSTCRCCPQLAQGDGEQDLRHPVRVLQALGNLGGTTARRARRRDNPPRPPPRCRRRATTRPRTAAAAAAEAAAAPEAAAEARSATRARPPGPPTTPLPGSAPSTAGRRRARGRHHGGPRGRSIGGEATSYARRRRPQLSAERVERSFTRADGVAPGRWDEPRAWCHHVRPEAGARCRWQTGS